MATNEILHKVRVLLVPDSIYWVTGTMARSYAHYHPWLEANICSNQVARWLIVEHPEVLDSIDLVHFICPYITRELLEPAKKRWPVVTTIHHVVEWDWEKQNVGGDAIQVVAEQWRRELVKYGVLEDQMVLVPNGVDIRKFKSLGDVERMSLRHRYGIRPDEFVVGFFGKFSSNDGAADRKGLNVFRAAVSMLKTNVPNAHVVIVGPGWDDLVNEFKNSGLRYTWHSFISDEAKLPGIYNTLDCYWITSRIEGGPVPLLEAMACGVPCISTPVGLVEDVIRDSENGFVVPFGKPEEIVAQTARIAGNRILHGEMSRAARETIASKWHYGVTTSHLPMLYAKAVQSYGIRANREIAIERLLTGTAAVNQNAYGSLSPSASVLSSIPRKWHSIIRAREYHFLADWMRSMGQQSECRKALRKEVLVNPWHWSTSLCGRAFRKVGRMVRTQRQAS